MKKQYNLETKVLKTIQEYTMIKKGDRILVAVSGGVDSMVLLKSLSNLHKELGVLLWVTHFNHQLRGRDADADERFVKKIAKKMKLKCITGGGDVRRHSVSFKMSIEEAARELRYNFFIKVLREYKIDKIALGHNLDDQAETVLIRLIKGTGLRGLSAIRPVLRYNSVCFIRPLIALRRDEIVRYARDKKISFREDKTNWSLKFIRNKIRHRLIPLLEKQFNPNVKEALARLAFSADNDLQYISNQAHLLLNRVIKRKEPNRIVLDRRKFCKYHSAICFRMLEEAICMISSCATLDFEHWRFFWNNVTSKEKTSINLQGKVILLVQYNDIVISSSVSKNNDFCMFLNANDTVSTPKGDMCISCNIVDKSKIKINKRKTFEYLDMSRIKFPLIIRNREPGDRFRPLGMKGKKKLKDFFIEKKVPQYRRDSIPLVISGNDIIWIIPYGISDDYKVKRTTKKVLRITFHPSRN